MVKQNFYLFSFFQLVYLNIHPQNYLFLRKKFFGPVPGKSAADMGLIVQRREWELREMP